MKFYFLLVCLFIILPVNVFSQDSLRTGVKYGGFPQLRFSSDDGLVIGGEFQRYNYGNIEPYESSTRLRATYITNGAYSVYISQDLVRTLGTDIRTNYDLFSSRNYNDYYLGDTELTAFNSEVFDTTSFYSFKSFRVNIGGATRFPFELGEGISRTDLKTGLRFVYETPWDTPNDRLMNSGNIVGNEGAFLTFLEIGVLFEARNSEFRADRGYLIDIGTKMAPPLISTHTLAENYLRILGFSPIFDEIPINLATRFDLKNTIGDVPYWFTPSVGGSGSIRGYMYRRFSSQNSITYSVELRSWLLKIPYKNIELGLNLFADGGRVFRNDNWGGILTDHNVALGFGGVMSIFTPDNILKYDVAFSEDGIGIYLGTGYSF